jgi:exodeoxyribonuclease VII large subunit
VETDGRAEVLILSRGGGATEDMACFNDERVVRAVAMCSIPVVAGIGHQRDESLADLVADVYAHTPTAAAEQAVPLLADLFAEHQQRVLALSQAMDTSVDGAIEQIDRLKVRLRRLHLDRLIREQVQMNGWRQQRLVQNMNQQLQTALQHCELLHQKLAALDPNAVLKRGYAMIRQEHGFDVRSAQQLQPGQPLRIQFARGQAKAIVTEIMPSNPNLATPDLHPDFSNDKRA